MGAPKGECRSGRTCEHPTWSAEAQAETFNRRTSARIAPPFAPQPVYRRRIAGADRASRAFERLNERDRLVFTLYADEQLDDEEIAQQLDLSREEVEAIRAEATRRVDDAARGENLRKPRAEAALVHRFTDLTNLEPDESDRLANLRPLVLETIGDAELEIALRDIAGGDGNELLWTRHDGALRPPSLHSIYSSCGLALNAFGPWRSRPQSLPLLGETGYTALSFEGKLPIFRGGRAPNLDVILADNERIVAVESKLTEHLAGGQLASFKHAYDAGIELADDSWRALYEWLKRTADAFAYLDAGQLVRHYLGLKKQTASGRTHEGKTATLLYVYWEPTNASELPACRSHTEEIAAVAAAVSDPQLSFVATTYSALWNEWERAYEPPWLGRHVALLQQRYELPL